MTMLKWQLMILLLLTTSCLGPVEELYPDGRKQRPVPVYIVSHGWHVGVVLEGRYLREKLPSHEQFPETRYVMIGWGDNRYYPADKFRLDRFLRAALLPTGSVLHIVGIDESVSSYFRNSDIVRVQLTKAGMNRMSEAIADYFKKNDNDDLIYASEGLYPNSIFYEAKGLYFFPRTSNRWTARILRQSGFPITPFYALTSGNVIYQVRQHGEVIRRRADLF